MFIRDILCVTVGAVTLSSVTRGQEVATCGGQKNTCSLYTSDAADDFLRVDLGVRRIIKKNNAPHCQ